MGRPLLEAMAAQQRQIDVLTAQIGFLGKVAGIEPQFAAIAARRTADVNNPGQPWPDPPSTGPSETTEQAATAEAHDDPTMMGETPGSMQHMPAETIDNPLNVGESLPTSPFGQVTDVTQPVAGTNTGEIPIPSVRTEVDVRVGNPDDPQPAYPWTIATNRTTASILAARLRIQAGLASGDDLVVAAKIEKDASVSDEMLEHEIAVLQRVQDARPRRQASRSAVPRSASVQRVAPSLVAEGSLSAPSGGSGDDAEDIFL